MSLSKQMILFISSLLIVLLAGTFLLNLSNAKSFLEEQLSSHAQDTATSLGLSLSSISDSDDISSMETMINAVFDRGYYSKILLNDMEGKPIYVRHNPIAIENIPAFFMNLIHIEGPKTEALVQGGWVPIGILTVQSHPGYAYSQLWDSAKKLLIWFLTLALLAIVVAIYTLKILFKPIKKVEQQAEAIVKKEYILQDKIPKTSELKQIVTAMNSMVSKMREVFDRDAKNTEELQKMAYQDSVTGLSNRLHFEMNVDSLLDKNEDNIEGAMLLTRINGLKELNDQYGYLLGDKLMKALTDKLMITCNQSALLARLNGTELIAVMAGQQGQKLEINAQQIAEGFPKILDTIQASDAPTFICVAVIDYQPGDRRGPLLAKLDYAIGEANKLGKNKAFYYQLEENAGAQQQNQEAQWQQIIDSAIQNHRFVLFEQTAFHIDKGAHNKELFIRLKDESGNVHSAGYFMPAVTKLNRTSEIDKVVIELALKYLKSSKSDAQLAINLSRSIIETKEFKDWLLSNINLERTSKLAFEISEQLIMKSQTSAGNLIKTIKNKGITFGIDNFGGQFSNMSYLKDINPDYIKLDASFSKAIERDQQTQTYIQSLYELCQNLDIDIIAMSVETDTQIDAFKELGIQYFQGYFYGAPQPLVIGA